MERGLVLIQKKDLLEAEILSIETQLSSTGANGPLIDNEGFPRSDIDIYATINLKKSLNQLKTDHMILMKEIEVTLYEIHSSSVQLFPFATVDQVLFNSPAERAGLISGDKIIEFGTLNSKNILNFYKDLPKFVIANEGKSVKLGIQRSNQNIDIILVPSKWEGSGLLGCHMIKINY